MRGIAQGPKAKKRGPSRAFKSGCRPRSAARDNRGGFGATADEPCENEENSKTDHCLGRKAPAGFLNVVVHDEMQDPFVRRAENFRSSRMFAGYAFAAAFATAKSGERMARAMPIAGCVAYNFSKIIRLGRNFA